MSNIYFISDLHIGIDGRKSSLDREREVVLWLQSIAFEARAIHLVGDVFDYWFEYKCAVPKMGHRLLGQLAIMADSGIEIHYYAGNHDMWINEYFEKDLGMIVHMNSYAFDYDGKRFFVAHGDGLGPGDVSYKGMKKLFRSALAQRIFGMLHPNIGLTIMAKSSKSSRKSKKSVMIQDFNKEWLTLHAEQQLKDAHYDFFIHGHRHFPSDHILSNGVSRYLNLGDWLEFCTYAKWDGASMQLLTVLDEKKSLL